MNYVDNQANYNAIAKGEDGLNVQNLYNVLIVGDSFTNAL